MTPREDDTRRPAAARTGPRNPDTPEAPGPGDDPFTPPDAERARSSRVHAALFRIAERHAATDARRARQTNPRILGPHEAVRLVSFLMAGSVVPDEGEPEVDAADVTAALTLLPLVRAELDDLEAGLLLMARGRGLTWQEIAFGLGLGTPQAARQRYERLAARTDRIDS